MQTFKGRLFTTRTASRIVVCAAIALIALLIPRIAQAQRLLVQTRGEIYDVGVGGRDDWDNFGRALAAADFDGDTYTDLAIGAPFYDDDASGDVKLGAVYVVWGPLTAESEPTLEIVGAPGTESPGWESGSSLAVIEDFNGTEELLLFVGSDGYNHEVTGSPPLLFTDAGRGDLYRYKTGSDEFEHVATVNPSSYVEDRRFSRHVSSIGDFNGDGNTDFIVGSHDTGYAAVYLGGTISGGAISPSFSITGTAADGFARGVHGGDLDGDANPDIVVAANSYDTNKGRVYVYLDRTTGLADMDEGDADFTITGGTNERFGEGVAVGFDVTGDGDEDIIAAAPNANKLFLFEGPVSASTTSASAEGTISGFEALGGVSPYRSVSIAGDVNGDGVHDILVADLVVGGSPGRTYLVLGGTHLASLGTVSIATLVADGVAYAMESELASEDGSGETVLSFPGVSGVSSGQFAVSAPDEDPGTSPDINDPGIVRIYEFQEHRVEFRQKGVDATNGEFDYTGTPSAAIVFDFNQSTKHQSLFISRASSASGLLYRISDVALGTGLAEFQDWTSTDEGFVSTDDLPQNDLRGGAAADFDADGDVDFVVAAPAGTTAGTGSRLYQNNGSGKYADISLSFDIRGTGDTFKEHFQNGTAASWADYDLDGQIDLLLTYRSGSSGPEEPILLQSHFTEDGDFEDVSVAEGIDLADGGIHSWTHGWADWDDDGDLDLFLGHEAHDTTGNLPHSRLYRNNLPTGSGFTEELAAVTDPGLSANMLSGDRSSAWTDLDRDGDLDLVLAKTNTTSSFSYLSNNGDETFDHAKFPIETSMLALQAVDYDYDASIDVLIMPESSGYKTRAWRLMDDGAGSTMFNDTAPVAQLDLAGGSPYLLAEDFAGSSQLRDGDPDLIIGRANASAQPADLVMQALTLDNDEFLEDVSAVDVGPDAHWVGVVLRGSGGVNSTGIGARVTCTFNSIVQVREVDGGSLRASQGSQVIRFGLGSYSGTASVQIDWPDGYSHTFSSLTADQIHEIKQLPVLTPTAHADDLTMEPGEPVIQILTFEWDTPTASHRQTSGVEIAKVSGGFECFEGLLQDGGDVTYTMIPVFGANGVVKYHHTLTWVSECVPCTYKWKAVAGTLNDTSGPQKSTKWDTLSAIYCPTE